MAVVNILPDVPTAPDVVNIAVPVAPIVRSVPEPDVMAPVLKVIVLPEGSVRPLVNVTAPPFKVRLNVSAERSIAAVEPIAIAPVPVVTSPMVTVPADAR